MAIRTTDGTQYKRIPNVGDMYPTATGFQREVATYVATGGESSINLALLSPALSYMPGRHQLSIKRSSGGSLMSTDFQELSSTSVGFSGDPLVAGEIVELTKEFTVTGVMAVEPRPDCYTAVATTGQTTVAADFSWTYNAFPSKGIGATRVYLNGVLQYRGTDYTEVGLGTSMTNTIQFVDPLLGGENIILLPTNQVIDDAGASTQFNNSRIANLQSMMTAGSQGFVDQSTDMIAVPNTTIVGRAKIPNLANDLRASLGVERIQTQAIVQLQNEFGPNGEPVFGVVNDDRGLIRFVGDWLQASTTNGQTLSTNTANDYVEVVFYGTGLNLLTRVHGGFTYYLDGSATPNTIAPVSLSGILDARSYSANIVVSIASGLSLGIHTVKLTFTASGRLNGLEILNANASGLVNINQGVGYQNGQKYVNSLADSVSYKANSYSFTVTSANATVGATYTNNGQTFTVLATIASGTVLVCSGTGAPSASGTLTKATGTGDSTVTFSAYATGMARGGRIVHYLNTDGTVGQAYQAVNAASATLTSADHTNEEVARVYSWREFGCGRTTNDDFSCSVVGNPLAFTLDDGTTTLVSNYFAYGPQNGKDWLSFDAAGVAVTLTFVGTGLDIARIDTATGGSTSITVSIDGAATQVLSSSGVASERITKVVSGLTYGTHTVKIVTGAPTGYTFRLRQFIVYGPKKPTIPATALELCDYNVMADYAAATGTAVLDQAQVPTGTLGKTSVREFVYIGAGWSNISIDPTTSFGWYVGVGTTNNQPLSYTFFGTGISIILNASSGGTYDFSVTIDGSLNASGSNLVNATNLTAGSYRSTSSTSVAPCRVAFTGLTLGLHTVSIARTAGTGSLWSSGIYVITPIHAVKSNLYADLQNTLPVGSCSLMDSRKTSMIKEILPAQKAWAQAVGVSGGPTTTSTAIVPIADMSVTIKTGGGPLQISFAVPIQINASDYDLEIRTLVDGVMVDSGCASLYIYPAAVNLLFLLADTFVTPVAKGIHKVDLYWRCGGGTLGALSGRRHLTVQEL